MRTPSFLTFSFFIFGFKTNFAEQQFTTIVNTNNGKVRGLRIDNREQIIDEFKGIPFAKPPVGPLRWKKPGDVENWDGILNATDFCHPCTQFHRRSPDSEEDCLYLNVFIPNGLEKALKSSLPVMFWTHGGGFQTGTPRFHPPQDLALTGDVIVVSHNYRLSVLGGLSTSDTNSPGNYLLWDTRAALVWVKNNIAQFGGDPLRVTVFGQSAGGAIVSHLVASPTTEGLFQRTIALSGVASGPIGIQHAHIENTKNVAILEGCPEEDSKELVNCLRTRDAQDVDRSGYPAMLILSGQLPGWAPVVDGDFVKEKPVELFRKGAGRNIDYIIGRTHDDAAGFVYQNMRGVAGDTGNLAADKSTLEAIMRFILYSYKPDDVESVVKAIKGQYPDIDSNDITERTKAVSRAITDFVWMSPMHQEAELHKKSTKSAGTGKKTFTYNFRYRPSFVHYAPWVTGSHSDDLYMVFGEPYKNRMREISPRGNYSRTDHVVSENIMKYYANFAYSGDPNNGPHKVPAQWQEYDPSTKNFMELSENMEMKKESKESLDNMKFWLNTFPNITDPDDQVFALTELDEGITSSAFEALIAVVKNYLEAMT